MRYYIVDTFTDRPFGGNPAGVVLLEGKEYPDEGLACSMRISLNEERDIVKAKLKVPATYMIPVFIGIGYADPAEKELEQIFPNVEKQLHFGKWK